MKYLYLILVFAVLISCKPKNQESLKTFYASSVESFDDRKFYDENGNLTLYNILNPKKVNKNELYPLMVFLHGAGERGDDNKAQLEHIAPIFAKDSIREKYPSFVVFPQCPGNDKWGAVDIVEGKWVANSKIEATGSLTGVMNLINQLISSQPIDTNRIYVSGLSMGGFGTYDILSRMPNTFAAAIAICGGGDPDVVDRYAHVPIKIFHGSKDDVVPPDYSRKMYRAIQTVGAANVEYIEYPEGKHNIWDKAYAEPGILDWIYSQKK